MDDEWRLPVRRPTVRDGAREITALVFQVASLAGFVAAGHFLADYPKAIGSALFGFVALLVVSAYRESQRAPR